MTWQQRASCLHPSVTPGDLDTHLIDDRGRVDLVAANRIANAICRRCPVRPDCLQDAVATAAQEVVRGGMWFPAMPYRTTKSEPIDLLADTVGPTSEGAAA